jgi:hypothetical protein
MRAFEGVTVPDWKTVWISLATQTCSLPALPNRLKFRCPYISYVGQRESIIIYTSNPQYEFVLLTLYSVQRVAKGGRVGRTPKPSVTEIDAHSLVFARPSFPVL